jgi:hypothetical protein
MNVESLSMMMIQIYDYSRSIGVWLVVSNLYCCDSSLRRRS